MNAKIESTLTKFFEEERSSGHLVCRWGLLCVAVDQPRDTMPIGNGPGAIGDALPVRLRFAGLSEAGSKSMCEVAISDSDV